MSGPAVTADPVLAGLKEAAAGPVAPDGAGFRAIPRSVEAACSLVAEAARRGLPVVFSGPVPEGGVLVDRSALDGIGPLDDAAMWIRAGGGASVAVLEAQLRARGLTLGAQPPSVLSRGTVAGWLEGPHAGRRAEDGRLGPGVAALEAVLPDGTLVRSRPAPRSAAGPAVIHLLLGGGGACGSVLAATIKAQPVPARTEKLAVSGEAGRLARLFEEVSYGLLPPLEVELDVREGRVRATLTFASDRAEARRRRARAESRATALGLEVEEPAGEAAADDRWELELPRAAVAAALSAVPPGARVRLVRIAREGAIAVTGADAGVALCAIAGVKLLVAPGHVSAPADAHGPGAELAVLGRIVAALRSSPARNTVVSGRAPPGRRSC